MGSVYAAIDEASGARVAVKVLHTEVVKDASSRDDTSKLTRFQREAKAASAIHSPHIASVTEWGTDDPSGQPFMVMELLDGEDLQQVLKRVEMLPPDVALRIAAQACLGLVHAHDARIMHRDIKPANLFLARSPSGEITVKLLDFGIAKIRPDEESGETTGLTRTGSMLGSPRYMSPEQARGRRTLDHRTDLWSLGVVLYRSLSGHMPHEDAEAVGEFIVMLCSEPPKPVELFAPWLSSEVAAVVDGALQIDRENRFENAAAMLEALRALLPNGTALRVEDLVALPDAVRGSIVPRAPDAKTGNSGNEETIPMPSGRTGRRALARKDDSTTPNTLANAQLESGQAPRRSAAPFVIGAAVALIGLATFGALRGSEMFTGPATGASAAPSGAPSSEAVRHANLVILPHDAAVEVDGAKAASQDGVVEIAGALGSVHRVKLSKDGQEKTAEVVLGESGAEPPKVELVLTAAVPSALVTASAAPSVRGSPGPKKTGATPITTAPTTKPKNPLAPDKFE